MNKGLEALYNSKQALNNIRYNYFESKREEDIDIEHFWFDKVEKGLKRLEELEEEKQSFDRQLEKKLKALEIIKNKEINVHALFLHLKRFDKPDGYNVLVGTKYQITQEEYDILKEVLL